MMNDRFYGYFNVNDELIMIKDNVTNNEISVYDLINYVNGLEHLYGEVVGENKGFRKVLRDIIEMEIGSGILISLGGQCCRIS